MEKHSDTYAAYVHMLREELVPAMGCTEPVAIAYCAAAAREALGIIPDIVDIKVSGNILKNAKSVTVPNTGGLIGVEAAAAAGIIGGRADQGLEVLSEITDEQKEQIHNYLESAAFSLSPTFGDELLEIIVHVKKDGRSAMAHIKGGHANIVCIERDGQPLLQKKDEERSAQASHKGRLNVKDIVAFAEAADIDDIREPLSRQIEFNSAISREGLEGDWGAHIGRTITDTRGDSVRTKAIAAAAAGADARMSGCERPVIIVSGSGNQGITASMPVITYARELGKTEEELLRALCVANLVALHIKTGIGMMSAFCGAVCAGCGAGAGIAYLLGADAGTVSETVSNCLGIISGTVCDGAKPSCAAKVAYAVDCGILGYEMSRAGKRFQGGEGIIGDDVEQTIRNIGRMGCEGMAETDHVIQAIMTE